MENCERNHDLIVHDCYQCPLCDALQEIEELGEEIEELEKELLAIERDIKGGKL